MRQGLELVQQRAREPVRGVQHRGKEDEDGEGNGEFTPEAKGEADPAWIAYIVAEK